jgi:hypothetical protein
MTATRTLMSCRTGIMTTGDHIWVGLCALLLLSWVSLSRHSNSCFDCDNCQDVFFSPTVILVDDCALISPITLLLQ